jgi:hypothetical protein
MTKFAGVPDTLVTVPLPNVVERKSSVKVEALIVKALPATDAEIGWICGCGVNNASSACPPIP